MLKRFKSVSLLLLTAGFTSSGLYATPVLEANAIEVTQQSTTCTGVVKKMLQGNL